MASEIEALIALTLARGCRGLVIEQDALAEAAIICADLREAGYAVVRREILEPAPGFGVPSIRDDLLRGEETC